ncbi:WD repeat-containing protein 19, partial [Perkinsus olseni]
PAIIGVGPRHIAAGTVLPLLALPILAGQGAGRRVYYHPRRDGEKTEREYPAKVEAVELSQSHAAVLAEGKIYIRSLKGPPAVTVLPAEGSKGDDGVKILSMRMTLQDILVYSTSGKELVHYDVEERCPINEYRHTESILAVYPNNLGGTYTAFLDAKGMLQVYNAVTEVSLSPVDHDRVGKIRGVLWDLADPSVFVVAADAREAAVLELHTFAVYDYSLSGPTVVPVGGAIRRSEVFYESIDFESGRDDPTTLTHGEMPVGVQNGRVTVQCQQPGELRTSDLASHSGIGSALRRMSNTNSGPVDVEEMERVVMRLAALGRMELAYRLCLSIPRNEKMGTDEGGRDELMRLIARQAVELLEVDVAILAYRECGDADRVAFLDRLVQLEDVPMLQGYLRVLLGQKQAAIESFVRAGAPREALDVMCDAQMWESAKGLATTVDQRRLPMIHRQVAMGLEDKGDYEGALASYKEALGEVDESRVEDSAEHFRACNAGLARCLCYCGMYEPAARLCERIAEEDVLVECAAILERMKQYSLAGRLHQRLGNLERACSLYIQDMDFDAAKPLMDQVSTPKLHLLYAKAKEARGFFKEAAASYEKGGDMESIVRLLVDESQLNDPRKAMNLIRKGRRRVGDVTGSIEFLTRARLEEMAFEMAVRHDQMPVYERSLAESEGSDELVEERYRSVAGYYKERNLPLEAAKNYVLCGEYEVAMELCLSLDQTNVSVDETAASVAGGRRWKLSPHMELAIDIAGRCHDEGLVNRLVDHLLRANAGLEDDELGYHQAQSIYKLHQVLGNYEESARIAMLIAKREQDEGRYKAAQSLLLKTYKDLYRLKMRIPRELWERLMLLQSYILVKPRAQLDEHINAALLLKRICQGNVLQSFRKHAAQTLASAVIECMKSGMKAEAHAYACELMRDAELRNRISEQLRKKIEVVVRKPPKGDQQAFQEALSPCPYCAAPLPDSSLSCGHCQNIVPFCAVTGLHVVLSDWSSPCGNCSFPMRYSMLERMLAHEKSIVCPMCSEELAASAVTKLSPEDALEEAEKFKRNFTRTMSAHENRS